MASDHTANKQIDRIAQQILAQLGDRAGRSLLYAEVDTNYVRPSLYYESVASRELKFAWSSPQLSNAILDFWDEWHGRPDTDRWSTLVLFIDPPDIMFEIQLVDLMSDEPLERRRTRVVERFFGTPPTRTTYQ